ncbi:Fic family protein [Niabella ginsengisoli]|uniref:Fic family protein n=1 Tax=Niabella ginsengisoli TaxID=522298 RepID=A0ABS9SIH4_9BACT|nr:Fic family protein [Niabella ginsengisoli]MCH5598151.1 Fic family protein [Niabella ginsengisoli]
MSNEVSINQLISKYEDLLINYKKNVAGKFAADDLFEYNEILFAAHSCAIEGNSFSVNDTKELKEHGLKLKLHNKSMLEAYEILDHFKAYEFVFTQLHLPLSEELLIQVHSILLENTIRYTKNYEPGEYTKTQMAAGDTIFPDHETSIKNLPQLMFQTQQAIEENKIHPLIVSAKFHKYFIYLHPFPDGNGRIARMFSNFILAKFNHPILIITNDQKELYIEVLKFSHKHNDMDIMATFFINTSIKRMENELQEIDFTNSASRSKGGTLGFVF